MFILAVLTEFLIEHIVLVVRQKDKTHTAQNTHITHTHNM